MKFTLSWLKEHLDTDANLEKITDTLTAIGLEVEEVVDRSAELAPFTVAEILEAEQHPDADKLSKCVVDNGSEKLQIVCGAPNARAGIKVALASVGSVIPTNGMKIKASKIRGVESNGMLCSSTELGIGEDSAGIIELPENAKVGKPFAPFLGVDDPLIEIAITPNRGDCLGVYGIARDLAAAGIGTLKPLNVTHKDFQKVPEEGEFDSPITVSIDDISNSPTACWDTSFSPTACGDTSFSPTACGGGRGGRQTDIRYQMSDIENTSVDKLHTNCIVPSTKKHPPLPLPHKCAPQAVGEKRCTFFIGRYIRGVKNAQSPDWLKKRLESVGLKSISALVDITNFLTLDLGRPAHVYDADKLKGNLVVRGAEKGEKILALDDKEYLLEKGMTVIADDSGVVSLGGIIGGKETGCSEDTENVFLEIALFDPISTAETGRKLQIDSDARYRFERFVAPSTLKHLITATNFITDICGGEVSKPTIAGKISTKKKVVELRVNRVKELIGIDPSQEEITSILESLGFKVDGSSVTIPSYRNDIEQEVDLIEEITRIYGFDKIPSIQLAKTNNSALTINQKRQFDIRKILVSRGMKEAVTFSFVSSDDAVLFNSPTACGGGRGGCPTETILKLANPISADLDAMRPSIFPSLLRAVGRNEARNRVDLSLFEIGAIFDKSGNQILTATGIRSGNTSPRNHYGNSRIVDVFDAKADALAALSLYISTGALQIKTTAPKWYHTGRSGTLTLGKTTLGYFGELHPAILKEMDIKKTVVGFEVFPENAPEARAKKSFSKGKLKASNFQSVERDFAFVVDDGVAANDVLKAVRSSDKKLIEDVSIFDVYSGKGIEEGKKSIAITAKLQPVNCTLTDTDIEQVSSAIIKNVEKSVGGSLRLL